MGQLAPDYKVVGEAVDDMIDIVSLHSDEGELSYHGTLLLIHRFEKVPPAYRGEVNFCFEAYINDLMQPRYDA